MEQTITPTPFSFAAGSENLSEGNIQSKRGFRRQPGKQIAAFMELNNAIKSIQLEQIDSRELKSR